MCLLRQARVCKALNHKITSRIPHHRPLPLCAFLPAYLMPSKVPDGALALFQHADRFRQQIGALDLMASLYNKLQRTTLAVEWPLVASKLEAVGASLIGVARLTYVARLTSNLKRTHIRHIMLHPTHTHTYTHFLPL